MKLIRLVLETLVSLYIDKDINFLWSPVEFSVGVWVKIKPRVVRYGGGKV